MPMYSHSKISTFETCPLKYKLRYIDKIVSGEEGIEAFMGSRVHSALEKLYRDKQREKKTTLEELLEFYRNEWEREWHDQIVINKKDCTKENYFDMGKKAIERYYGRFRPFEQAVTVWIEEQVNFNVGRFKMTGFVDRLDKAPDGSYEIHDYKTSGHLPQQSDMDNDRQLALYEVALRSRWKDVKKVRLVWHYLVFDQDITSKRTKVQLKALEMNVASLIERIEAETDFKPTPCGLCNWCEYWQYCPEKKHLVKISEMKPKDAKAEDGFALVNEFTKLKAQEKEVQTKLEDFKERIISYAGTEGLTKVRGSSTVASISTTDSLSLPSKSDKERYGEVVDAVKQAGLWEEFSVLDTRGLAEGIESGVIDPMVKKKLKTYVEEKKTVTVRLSKLKDYEE
jgi:putative RecB family exonuclease